jgi:hypothetical protein
VKTRATCSEHHANAFAIDGAARASGPSNDALHAEVAMVDDARHAQCLVPARQLATAQ